MAGCVVCWLRGHATNEICYGLAYEHVHRGNPQSLVCRKGSALASNGPKPTFSFAPSHQSLACSFDEPETCHSFISRMPESGRKGARASTALLRQGGEMARLAD